MNNTNMYLMKKLIIIKRFINSFLYIIDCLNSGEPITDLINEYSAITKYGNKK